MLNIQVNCGDDKTKFVFSGKMEELLSETTYIIHRLYNSLHRRGQMVAAVFRDCMTACMTDPHSPVWVISEVEGEQGIVITAPKTPEE